MEKNPHNSSKDNSGKRASPADDPFVRVLDFILKFKRFTRDIIGILLAVLALLTLLALIGLTSGEWITPWADFLQRWFGWGSVLVVVAFGVAGSVLMQKQRDPFTASDWRRVIWLEASAFAILALLALIGGGAIGRAEQGKDGGLIGWGIAEFFGVLMRPLPEGLANPLKVLLISLIAILGILFGFGLIGKSIAQLEKMLSGSSTMDISTLGEQPAVVVGEEVESVKVRKNQKHILPPEYRKDFKVTDQPDEKFAEPPPRDDRMPPLDLLQVGEGMKPNERHINQTAGLIEKTLADFGIPAKVIGFKVGPTITQFAVEPGYLEKSNLTPSEENRQKVRVAQISGLRRDLALALSAERLRIQAPVPGRAYIGIEVPNEKSVAVRLKPILETEVFYKVRSALAIALGRDVSGQPVVADLSRMPHLLIAGTTGSGKSVCIAALTACLVMNNSPEDLRIVMIDPKMVELVRFNGLPHLYGKVETSLDRINSVLRWVVEEMQQRYKLLEELRARDLDSYNRKVRRRKEYEPLPRIVVLIDELADLMMSSAEQTEATIVRLAQMARATGIHLVIATQRPSTDVVTGLIKANFPARISFAVASGVDSRVIIDSSGAETLLGKGDMLFLNPEEGAPIRAQGVIITDQEIEKIIAYWQKSWPVGEELSPWEQMIEDEAVLADRDGLVEQAIELIQQTGRASTSLIQRRLKIGYPRAARLMDELEDMGVVGPSMGGGREREILIDIESDELE